MADRQSGAIARLTAAFISACAANPAVASLCRPTRPPMTAMEAALLKLCETPSDGLGKLPNEVRLFIVEYLGICDGSESPSRDLIALSKTCRWFYKACKPVLWREVIYIPASRDWELEHERERDLRRLVEVQQTTPFFSPPIRHLILRDLGDVGIGGSIDKVLNGGRLEIEALGVLIVRLGATLESLTLDNILPWPYHIQLVLRAIMSSVKISRVRLERVQLLVGGGGQRYQVDKVGLMRHIKVLQLVRSDGDLLKLVPLCPNLHSLVIKPTRRTATDVSVTMFKTVMPQLRRLALTSAGVANIGRDWVELILRLADEGVELQLEQVILEGWGVPQPDDFAVLVKALARLPRLRLLSLQGMGCLTAAGMAVLVRAAPRLDTLSLIGGCGTCDFKWPSESEDYFDELGKLEALEVFSWDCRVARTAAAAPVGSASKARRNPPRAARNLVELLKPNKAQAEQMGRACGRLREVFFRTGTTLDGIVTGHGVSLVRTDSTVVATTASATLSDTALIWDDWMKR
ncbi:hypothetical protein JCM9279_001768 [Rhodotorula babjevae]